MLLHVPQVLTSDQVRAMCAALDGAAWSDGRASVGEQGARVKRNRQLPADLPLTRELGGVVLAAVGRHPLFFAAALPLRCSPPLFSAYEDGEAYGLHVDGAVRMEGDPATAIRTDMSCTLFLREPDAYEGGELEIVDTYGAHEVKLPAGDLILYPSSSLHRVRPVASGTRVCAVFWLQSMVRDDASRTMLFELDRTIGALRGKHGDTDETVALTAHYHNLLRRWADV
jgi:PKHD-type hydroxylase